MKAAHFRPIFDRVLIKQDEDVKKTEAGVLIPEKYQGTKELVSSGVIIAIGPGKKHHKSGVFIETTVKVGQRVVWRKHGGIKVPNLEDHVITTEDELLGTMEEG